jgi:hypothetical protein
MTVIGSAPARFVVDSHGLVQVPDGFDPDTDLDANASEESLAFHG